jgi:transglutaminase-like putative cysteine protease
LRSKPISALFFIFLLAGTFPHAANAKRDQFTFRSTYAFENRGETAYNVTQADSTLFLFMENRWQTVTTRNASHAILKETVDEDGNGLAIVDLPSEISAGETMIFSIEYVIHSEDMPRPEIDPAEAGGIDDIPVSLVGEYTGETESFRRNDDIESLARELAAEETTVLGVVTRLIGWIVTNVTYCNFDTPLYPDETFNDLQGDCDDQAILLISLLRSLGIPAFLQVGVVFSESIESDKSSWEGHLSVKQNGVGWHGWALVYVPPWGWIPVDLTLTTATEPLEIILRAPEYESSIVPTYNVSKKAYIGDSRRSREQLIASDLYITISETFIEESIGSSWSTFVYIGVGLTAGAAFVVIIIYLSKRNSSLEETKSN